MPKVVDHAARRRELGRAVWRVIQRDGLAAASVRGVAREAGWSMGALRYYFGTQSELLAFALRLIGEGIRERIHHLELPREPHRAVEAVEAVLLELVPLDAERHTEAEVWLAFTGRALVDSTLRTFDQESDDALYHVCRKMVAMLAESGQAPELHVELEAERVYALLDGLCVHAVMRPERVPPGLVREVLGHHLGTLVTAAGHGPTQTRDERATDSPS